MNFIDWLWKCFSAGNWDEWRHKDDTFDDKKTTKLGVLLTGEMKW
jgi:hypothetical protein